VLPLAMSLAIHTVAVTLVLALTFSPGMVERLRPTPATRTMILLARPPVIQASAHVEERTIPKPPRLFRPPVVPLGPAPRYDAAPVSALQVPVFEVPRLLLPTTEVARLPAAPAPPLRTDNLAPLAPVPNSAIAVLRSSGFEQNAVQPPRRLRALPLSGGEFGDATVLPVVHTARANVAPALPVTRSVEVLSKPRPAYTDDARRQRIEGEVLLEVLFAASGQVRVLRIVRSLSDGLDDNAVAAAEAIRFRPAERAGIAADSTAIVHIVFQLAF